MELEDISELGATGTIIICQPFYQSQTYNHAQLLEMLSQLN